MNDREERVRQLIIARRERNITYLKAALNDGDPALRRIAIRYLVKLGASDAAASIRRLLRVADRDVRIAAIIALGKMRSTEALPEIQTIVENDRIAVVRAWALHALMKIDHDTACKVARSCWRDDTWDVRARVLETLAKFGDRSDLKRIQDASSNEPDWKKKVYYWKCLMILKRRLRKSCKKSIL